MVDDIDNHGEADAGVLTASAGTYKTKRTGRVGAYAKASVAEANASCSVFGASASAQADPQLSARATASLARAEANAGPLGIDVGLQADSGLSG